MLMDRVLKSVERACADYDVDILFAANVMEFIGPEIESLEREYDQLESDWEEVREHLQRLYEVMNR